MGVVVGNLLAAGVFYVVTMLSKDDLLAWGWRIPFLISLLLLGVGIYIRAKVAETPVFSAAETKRPPLRAPAIEALRRHPRNFFVVIGARLAENGLGYLFPVFGLGYVINTLHMSREVAITGVMLGNAFEVAGVVFFAWLSDSVGRRPVYLFGALFSAAFAFPFFWLTNTLNPVLISARASSWSWVSAAARCSVRRRPGSPRCSARGCAIPASPSRANWDRSWPADPRR